jgi:hypothetical protein
MRVRLLVLLLLLIAACQEAPPQDRSSFDYLRSELPKFRGKPVDVLVDRWGFPDAEQFIMQRRVYIWQHTRNDDGYRVYCRVRVVVDAAGTVERTDWNGHNGPCARYASRLLY